MEPSSFTTLATETDAVDDRRSYEYWENGNEADTHDHLGADEYADDLEHDDVDRDDASPANDER